jgi:hypothetical protein
MTRRTWVSLLAVAGLALAACSGDDSSSTTTSAADAATTVVDTTDVDDTEAPADTAEPAETTEAPVETTEPPLEPSSDAWEAVAPGGDCQCSDGSEFNFWVREADPTKVVLYFEGGGACFSEGTCDPEGSSTYKVNLANDSPEGPAVSGLFDFADQRNPIADHTVVFVPYCTGDVHVGSNIMQYSDTLTVNHVGFVNGSAALDHLAERFPDAATIVVSGESAGSIPSPLFAGLVADRFPEASITQLGDGSGGYPDAGPVNAAIGSLWGTMNSLPDWPANEGMTPEEWSIPGLYVQTGLHAPQVRLARYDFAYDRVQQQFSSLAGVGGDDLLKEIDGNDAMIRDAGITFHTYTAAGDGHTILRSPGFYAQEVEGVLLYEWVTALLAGDDVPEVRCTVCT